MWRRSLLEVLLPLYWWQPLAYYEHVENKMNQQRLSNGDSNCTTWCLSHRFLKSATSSSWSKTDDWRNLGAEPILLSWVSVTYWLQSIMKIVEEESPIWFWRWWHSSETDIYHQIDLWTKEQDDPAAAFGIHNIPFLTTLLLMIHLMKKKRNLNCIISTETMPKDQLKKWNIWKKITTTMQ